MMKQIKTYINDLFHIHQWEIIEERTQELYTEEYEYPTTVYKIYFMRCNKCGKIKMKKFKI